MAVAGTGAIMAVLERVRDELAPLASVQTWMGVANATEAAARIHLLEVGVEPAWPHVLLDIVEDEWMLAREVGDAGVPFSLLGSTVVLQFHEETAVDDQATPPDALVRFANAVGGMLSDYTAAETDRDAGDDLTLESVEAAVMPTLSSPNEGTERAWAVFVLAFGRGVLS